MFRVLIASLLSVWLLLIGSLSYGLEDSQFLVESWFCSFSLPIWSIISIGLWYDVGRLIFGEILSIDSKQSIKPLWVRSLLFIFWMSIIFTYVGISLKNLLIKDWSSVNYPDSKQIITICLWGLMSYLTYWILSIGWILIRVFVMDMTTDGFVYTIQ